MFDHKSHLKTSYSTESMPWHCCLLPATTLVQTTSAGHDLLKTVYSLMQQGAPSLKLFRHPYVL